MNTRNLSRILRRAIAGALAAGGIALAMPALALPTIQEGFNENETPTTANWALNSAGWFWTPESDFSLVGIQTRFNPQGGDPTVTVVLMDDRGGNVLRQADFSAASAMGQLGGGIFATPIDVNSATTYFVGFENIDNIGVNVVGSSPDVDEGFEGAPPGLFADDDNIVGNFAIDLTPDANQGLCERLGCPIIAFLTDDGNGGDVPEPATLLLLGGGFLGLGYARRHLLTSEGGK